MIRRLWSLVMHVHRWGPWRPCSITEWINGRQMINTAQFRQCRYTKVRKLGW